MKAKTFFSVAILTVTCASRLGVTVSAADAPTLGSSDTIQITPLPMQITERGAFYKVVQAPVEVKNLLTGAVSIENHAFTMLEDGMHYWDKGQWLESKDLIEIKGDSAVAIHGPGKAVFNPSTLAPVVVDYLTPEGQRLQSRVNGLYYFDEVTGQRVQIADVQESSGSVYPPNQVIYTNVFDSGVEGDLIYTSTKAGMEQDIVLTGGLPDPVSLGFKSSAIKLEICTTFLNAPSPKITPKSILRMANSTQGQTQQTVLMDDTVDFGGTWMPLGRAYFSYDELNARGSEPARIELADPANPDEVLVGKKWVSAGKNAVLVESVDLNELKAKFKIMQHASAQPADPGVQRASAARRPSVNRAAKIQLAKAHYSSKGVIVDYSIKTGTTSSFTFTNGATYLITNSFTVGDTGSGTAIFQPNACIKYANNAYLMLIGGVTFQTNGSPTVFTAYDDNFYGERLPNSSGNPTNYASPAVSLYYIGYNRTIANALFRWAKRGISMSESVAVSDTVKDSRFEYSYNGIYEYLPSGTLTLIGVSSMLVNSNIYAPSGSYTGSFTTDYGVVSNARINDPAQDNASGDPDKNSQSECSFVLVDTNRIVAAFWDTHWSEYGLGSLVRVPSLHTSKYFPGVITPRSTGYAVSTNGGTSFSDLGAIPPYGANLTNATQGDVGDPVMARDTGNSNIYLLVNPARDSGWTAGFRLWKSTDNGQTLSLINTNVPNMILGGDKPMIAVNNWTGLSTTHHLYMAGTRESSNGVFAAHSSDGGATFDNITSFEANGHGVDIAIRSNGTVYVFWVSNGPPYALHYSWLPINGSWHSPVAISAHPDSAILYATADNGSGNPKRSNSISDTNDFFVSNAFPRAAVNPTQDRIYLVYADLPSNNPGNDCGDIFIQEGIPNADGSLNWSGAIKVNNDNTATDQWNPSIAVNPAGTKLFVGYYSRQEDTNNSLIKAYGARARLDNPSAGASYVLTNATFDIAAISSIAFAPLFPGPTSSTPPENYWAFDHVWVQESVWFNTNAYVVPSTDTTNRWAQAGNEYRNFCADDYTWSSADNNYFYYAWCDRSDTYTNGVHTRPDANVRLAKIKQ